VDAPLEFNPGDVLAGKYRIERVLGQGGMGVVVAATHLQLDERIAIKFLLSSALQNQEAVARFAREARAAVKIKSEHVARVTDVGTLETGCPYMVMEYLHGSDLGGLVQQRGPLPYEEAVDFVLQASEAIAEAHSLGIIHRDLKPANLFYTQRADGSACIKVLDFGISKITGLAGSGSDLGMTRTTTVMGSPLYMSPEQMASSRDVDVRTDIWALGVILYELLAGQVPFSADTMPQLCAMILQHPAPPLRNVRPDAPEALQAALLRCLEKDPARRFANMAEFAAALLPFSTRSGRTSVERISRLLSGQGLSNSQLQVPPTQDSMRPGGTGTQAAWGQTAPPARGKAPLILAGVALLAIGAGAMALLLGRGSSSANDDKAAAALLPAASSLTPAGLASPSVAAAPPSATPPTSASAATPTATPEVSPATPKNAAPARATQPLRASAVAARPTAKKPERAPGSEAPPPPPPKRAAADLYSDRK
jgi:serine/threonine protein kinase